MDQWSIVRDADTHVAFTRGCVGDDDTEAFPKEIELAPRLLADAGLRSDGSRKPAGRCAAMSRGKTDFLPGENR